MKKKITQKRILPRIFLLTTLFAIFSFANISITNAQDYYSFDNPTDLTDNFNGSGSTFTYTTTSGLNGSGCVAIPSSGTEVWTSKMGYPVEVGSTYTISAYFYNGGNNGYGGIGFGSTNSNQVGIATSGIPDISIGMGVHSSGGSFINNGSETNITWDNALDLGQWYYVVYSITNYDADYFDATVEIYDTDETGIIGALKTSHTEFGIYNMDLGMSMSIYPLFSNNGDRMYFMDDFSVYTTQGGMPNNYTPPIGMGTFEDPYQIETLDNLGWLSEAQSEWDKYFIQTADIDAFETQTWNMGEGFLPIGKMTGFFGYYDGQGYAINNLYINKPSESYVGLFSIITYSGTVTNLEVTSNFTGNRVIGALAGYSEGAIINCSSQGIINGNDTMGGLVGQNEGLIENSYSFASVYCSDSGGGLVGVNYYGSVNNCYSVGSVDVASNAGGLIGIEVGAAKTVTNSFWDTETSGQTTSGGGTEIGLPTAQMQIMGTYTDAGWDFVGETQNGINDIWDIDGITNGGYPFLNYSIKEQTNNALHFDGIDDYVEASNINFGTGDFTIETWFKYESGSTPVIFAQSESGSSESIRLEINGSNLDAILGNSAETVQLTAPNIQANTWYHVAVVRESLDFKIYLNGELQDTKTSGDLLNFSANTHPFRIGARGTSSIQNAFGGYIDELRGWSFARSQCDIVANMHTELTGNEESLALYYNFNQGTVGEDNTMFDILLDQTVNLNDGMLNNFALIGATSNWTTTTGNISGIGENLSVCYNSPIQGETNVPSSYSIIVNFNNDIDFGTINQNTFKVVGSISGTIHGDYSQNVDDIIFTPYNDYHSNETVEVTLTTDIIGLNGETLFNNYRFSFTVDTLYDFGDLPQTYSITLNSDDGARHSIGNLFLGQNISPEQDGMNEMPQADADIYDDGIVVPQVSWQDGTDGGTIEATITGGNGYLSAWIDWNDNNSLEDIGDKILDNYPVEEGTQMITFDIPAGTITAAGTYQKYARFRLDDENLQSATTGEVTNGEVEDYYLTFSNTTTLSVEYVLPEDGSLDIPTDSEIMIDFNQNIDQATVSENSLYLESLTLGIIEGTYNINQNKIIFTPNAPLPSLDLISINITTDVLSLSGLALTESQTYTFTTEEVSLPPTILEDPTNINVCAGEDVYFSVMAEDNGQITYQWQENSGSGFVDIIENETYTGTTSDVLIIKNTSHLLNNYQYQCLVSNEIGTTTSNIATLTVNGQLAEAGDNISFYFDTYPVPTVDDLMLTAEAPINGFFGTWSTTSTASIINPENNSTIVNGIESGISKFYWTLSDGMECVNTDSLAIIIGSSFIPNGAVVDWGNPDNWTPPAIPGPNDSVSVYGAVVNVIGGQATCSQLYVGVNSTLNVSGSAKGVSGSIRAGSIEIEQDIEKYPNAGKGTANVVIGSGGSIEIEQDIEKSRSNQGLRIGSGGSIEIEQDIEKLGEPPVLRIKGLDLIIEGTDPVKSPALARIGNGGSIEIEQDIEKGGAGSIYVGSNGSIEIEQDIEKASKGVTNISVRGGSIEIEQDIEKKGVRGAANLIIRNGGSIEIEQDIEKKGTVGSLKIGNGGTLTIEGNYIPKDRSFANVTVAAGGSIEIEQDIEKATKGVANVNIRGGSIEIEQDIEKGASGQLYVGTGGSIEIEQDIEKGTDAFIYSPKVMIYNGNIIIGNTIKNGKSASASLNCGHIEIEQDIEKDRLATVGLNILSNGELAYDPSFELLFNEFIYMDSLAAITVEQGGQINFNYPNHKKFTINETASLIGDWTAFTGKSEYINSFVADQINFFSVPIQGETNEVYQGETVLYWTENNQMWNEVEPTTEILPVLGYAGVFSKDMTVKFDGNLLSGDQNVALTANNSLPFGQSGWNFVGNPYPSYVDFNQIIFDENIAPVKYVLNGSNNSIEIYCQNGISLNNGNQYIKDGEAFFVKALNNTSFNFSDDQRLHYFNQIKQENKADGDQLTLKLTDAYGSDYMKVVFDEMATENYDIQADAPAITAQSADWLSLCFVTPNQEELAINSMPSPMTETKVYDLYFNPVDAGNFTISVEDITIGSDISVHLKDNVENSFIELHGTSEYTFTATTDDPTDRFTLHFNDDMTSSKILDQNSLKIYSNKNTVYVNIPDNQGSSTINIIDMKGIKLSQKVVNGSGLFQIEMNKPTGYYIVNVTSNKGTVSQKVFIMQ